MCLWTPTLWLEAGITYAWIWCAGRPACDVSDLACCEERRLVTYYDSPRLVTVPQRINFHKKGKKGSQTRRSDPPRVKQEVVQEEED